MFIRLFLVTASEAKLVLCWKQYLIDFRLRLSFILKSSQRRCSIKKLLLKISKISQNSYENTCIKISFLDNNAGLWAATLLETLRRYSFPKNYVKFLRAAFLLSICIVELFAFWYSTAISEAVVQMFSKEDLSYLFEKEFITCTA